MRHSWLAILYVVLSAALRALAQPSGSIAVDRVLYAGRPNPQVIITSSTNPTISTLESFLQNLPPTSQPNWPNLGPRGFLLENNNVPTFPQEVRVFQGVIRTFQTGTLHYFLDFHGFESELTALFQPGPSAPAAEVDYKPETPLSPDQLNAVTGLPTNGSEPIYNPGAWNDHDGIEHNNNDYNYSANKMTGTFAQPGRAAGKEYTAFTCPNIFAAVIADGLLPWASNVACPKGCYKIAFVVNPGMDYHSYRQDRGGNWSHKPGQTEVTNKDESGNLITDPRTADRGAYNNFCGFTCVSANPNIVNIR